MRSFPGGALDERQGQRIPKWDFHWQQLYFYANGGSVYVPKGTDVRYTCTWDNTTSSAIRWGEGTADEMCIAFFYTTLF